MAVLMHLVQAEGRTVTTQELLNACWPGRVVVEAVVHNRIAELRSALKDGARNSSYIRTVPGLGYAVVRPELRPRRRPWGLLAGIGTAVIVLILVLLSSSREETNKIAHGRASLAVLPFANMSPDPDSKYLGDGVAEEIINRLTTLTDIKVIARTSSFQFRESTLDARAIGESLGVTYLIEGSVRRSGDRVRISAKLVDTGTGAQIWAKSLERSGADLFAMQDQIASDVLEELQIQFHDRPASRGTRNPEAFAAYTAGRFYNDRSEFAEGRRHLRRAIQLDPNYADAYVAIARGLAGEATFGLHPNLAELRGFVARAIELDPDHSGALAMRAWFRSTLDHDHQDAINELADLVRRVPRHTLVLGIYRLVLWTVGRHNLCLEVDAHLISIDPRNPNALGSYAHDLANLGRWDDARRVALRIRALGESRPANTTDVNLAVATGDLDAMPALLAEARELFGSPSWTAAAYYHAIGDEESLAGLLEKNREAGNTMGIAELTGDFDGYLEALELCIDEAPFTITNASMLVPWPMFLNDESIFPLNKTWNDTDEWARVRRKANLHREALAAIDVPPLPF